MWSCAMAGAARHQATAAAAKICMILGTENFYSDLAERLMNAATHWIRHFHRKRCRSTQ